VAKLTFFNYIHKETVLHRMDGRLKLLSMILLTVAVSRGTRWEHYVIITGILGLGLIFSKLPLKTILKEMKPLFLILFVILVLNRWHLAGRVILMLMASLLMVGTTPLSVIRNTIQWCLRPIPFVPEVQVATIINLTFVMIPVIFDHVAGLLDSQKARCVQLRKNPIQRVRLLVLPLLNRTLRQADALTYAMEARCYSQNRTGGTFKTNPIDWLILFLCFFLWAAIFTTS